MSNLEQEVEVVAQENRRCLTFSCCVLCLMGDVVVVVVVVGWNDPLASRGPESVLLHHPTLSVRRNSEQSTV